MNTRDVSKAPSTTSGLMDSFLDSRPSYPEIGRSAFFLDCGLQSVKSGHTIYDIPENVTKRIVEGSSYTLDMPDRAHNTDALSTNSKHRRTTYQVGSPVTPQWSSEESLLRAYHLVDLSRRTLRHVPEASPSFEFRAHHARPNGRSMEDTLRVSIPTESAVGVSWSSADTLLAKEISQTATADVCQEMFDSLINVEECEQ